MLSSITIMTRYKALTKLSVLTWITFLFLKIHITKSSPCMVKDGSSIFLTIPESFPPGRVFKTLDMIEGDASVKGNINLRLKEPNPYFALDGVSKNLLLLHQIDREFLESKSPTKSVQKLTTVCEYLDGDTWRRIDIPIQIVVTDVNDFTPRFLGTPYRVTVSELTPVGSIIYKNIRAEDGDATNNLIDYSIVKGPYSSYVRFDDSLAGNLVLNSALDYETLKVFNITVAARDQGNPPLTATTNVEITVQDSDDHSPEFVYPSYTATLPREAPRGYALKIRPEAIRAVDKDVGISASIEYRIVEGSSFFDVNKRTGEVFVNGTVASGGLYVLTVRASQVDNPTKFTLATLRITAERPNHNPPRFVQKEYVQKVPENIPVGSTVISVRATDPDPDSTLAYSLLSPELVPHFNLSISGDLMVARPLDYEVTKQYVMFVGVTDGEFTDQARVIIDVININDHDPEFGQAEYSFDVGADARVDGAILGKLDVTDRDGDNVTLSLLNHQETFEIHGREIVVTDASLLNQTQYRLSIVAQDNGSPPRRSFTSATVHFPPLAMAAVSESNQYFVLALVLGSVAGFLILVVACLVCYLGRTRPWIRKSPAGCTGRTCSLDEETRGLTYKQRLPYLDIGASSSSSSTPSTTSSNVSDTGSSSEAHPASSPSPMACQVVKSLDRLAVPRQQPIHCISAWESSSNGKVTRSPSATLTAVTPDVGLSPKGIILSTGHNTRSMGPLRKPKRLKWEDEEQPTKYSDMDYGWNNPDTLSHNQMDTERPEVTVYF